MLMFRLAWVHLSSNEAASWLLLSGHISPDSVREVRQYSALVLTAGCTGVLWRPVGLSADLLLICLAECGSAQSKLKWLSCASEG